MAFLIPFGGKSPRIAAGVFLAPTATVIGDVMIEAGASIWFGAVLRGDFGRIIVGAGSSIQDNAVIHAGEAWPTIIGENVTVGHGAVVEGARIGDGAVIGMSATVLPHATVGTEAVVAAGSVVAEGMEVPDPTLAAGAPAVVKKSLSGNSLSWVRRAAPDYHRIAREYLARGIDRTRYGEDT